MQFLVFIYSQLALFCSGTCTGTLFPTKNKVFWHATDDIPTKGTIAENCNCKRSSQTGIWTCWGPQFTRCLTSEIIKCNKVCLNICNFRCHKKVNEHGIKNALQKRRWRDINYHVQWTLKGKDVMGVHLVMI